MARRRRSPLKKALHAMAPHRVLWRALSGPEVMSGIRSVGRPTTKMSPEARRKKGAEIQRKAAVPAKKTAAKKTTKRPDPYAVARVIPGQNRAAGAKQAKAAVPGAAKKAVAVRKKDGSGRFDGRKAMAPRELAAFERAEQGYVDPALRMRNPRTRRG